MRQNLIEIDNYLLEVDDKDFNAGSKVLHKESIYTVKEDTGEYLRVEEYTYIGIRKDLCKKILSHLPLNGAPHLDGVDVFPPNWRDNGEKEDVEQIGKDVMYNKYSKFTSEELLVFERQDKELNVLYGMMMSLKVVEDSLGMEHSTTIALRKKVNEQRVKLSSITFSDALKEKILEDFG
jgi:hypothetical protein